jgi:hypothetical protein
VWIFGLRRTPAYPACTHLLDRVGELSVVVPRQVLQELQANLNDEELRALFELAKRHPTRIILDWRRPPIELIRKHRELGFKRGDAVVAAHVESLGLPTLVSENRDLLRGVPGLPLRIVTAAAVLAELEESPRQA